MQVKRFSEAFFLVEQPRETALSCLESNYAAYAATAEAARNSRYLSSLPRLPLSCVETDGDASSLPIIFEDLYVQKGSSSHSELEEAMKRRNGNRKKRPQDKQGDKDSKVGIMTHGGSTVQRL